MMTQIKVHSAIKVQMCTWSVQCLTWRHKLKFFKSLKNYFNYNKFFTHTHTHIHTRARAHYIYIYI